MKIAINGLEKFITSLNTQINNISNIIKSVQTTSGNIKHSSEKIKKTLIYLTVNF